MLPSPIFLLLIGSSNRGEPMAAGQILVVEDEETIQELIT
jgi:hypothetical protein